MDYAALDHLSLFAESNHSRLKQDLQTKGLIDQNGNPDINMINIRTGTFTAEIVNKLAEEQYDIHLFYDHLANLIAENEVRAAYYFLYSIIKALDMEMPLMFIQACALPAVLQAYLDEFLADFNDCMKDYLDVGNSK
jgi:hypothetical protein